MFEHLLNSETGGTEMDRSASREQALAHAVDLHRHRFEDFGGEFERAQKELLGTASALYAWLVGPASLSLTFGPIVDQTTHEPTGRNGSAMTQMRDNQQFTVTLTAQDAKGAEVLDDATTGADDPTWVSDDEGVFTWDVNPDNPREATAVAGLPGSAVGTVTIGEISATVAVDVVAGAIALVQLQTGEVVDQEPAPETPEA